MLTWSDILDEPEIRALSCAIQKARANSTVEVDVIFQGGGMLGMAHVGALHAMELRGFSIARVAGTSAGAIAATLAAAAIKIQKGNPISYLLFEDLASMQPSTFLDGSEILRKAVIGRKRSRWWSASSIRSHARTVPRALSRLFGKYGLHPAQRFECWLDERLGKYGISSLQHVNALGDRLKVVATALPGGIKVVLPDHSHLFDIFPSYERPSLYARASMAVPVLFDPVSLPLDNVAWKVFCSDTLKNHFSPSACEQLSEASHAVLFDGGLHSNLPVDVFQVAQRYGVANNYPPRRRIALALYSSAKNPTIPGLRRTRHQFFRYIADLLMSMRNLRDVEARARMSALEVVWIDTGSADWLDFSDNSSQIQYLFLRGMRAVHAHMS